MVSGKTTMTKNNIKPIGISEWMNMSTYPISNEDDSFLLQIMHGDDLLKVSIRVIHVTNFEGQAYPDELQGIANYNDRINLENCIAWAKVITETDNDKFHCFDCGEILTSIGLGFLHCSKCTFNYLPSQNNEGDQKLTQFKREFTDD